MNDFRLKRKMQISLRRFLMSEAPCYKYNQYFGVSKIQFRQWMELQFTAKMWWTNHGEEWDIDHRIPICYFDLDKTEELALAYNFLNTRPGHVGQNRNKATRMDVGEFRQFFFEIAEKTGMSVARQMVQRIDSIDFGTETKVSAKQLSLIESIMEEEKKKPTPEKIIADILAKKKKTECLTN